MGIKRLLLLLILFFCFLTAEKSWAGFGISPPYLMKENLGRGSHFEQEIILVRDNPLEDWKAEFYIEAPGFEDWIKINKGKETILPKGEIQTSIVVSVDVPKNAEYKRYRGALRVKTYPLNPPTPGTVAIAVGGRIEIDLTVSKEIFDFKVKGVKFGEFEEGHKFLFWDFPGKIKFWINIENIGNVPAKPSKVVFDIYNEEQTKLLETVQTTKLEKVKPFETKWILVQLPTKLKAGGYWADYKIYKKKEIVQQAKIHFSILPFGTLPKREKIILGLAWRYWLAISLGVVGLLIFGIVKLIRFLRRK